MQGIEDFRPAHVGIAIWCRFLTALPSARTTFVALFAIGRAPITYQLVAPTVDTGHCDGYHLSLSFTQRSRSSVTQYTVSPECAPLPSPATADRLLRAARRADRPAAKTTTQRGALLKHQIPIRTFQDWNETAPGFCEADLVAHCGWSSEGAYLQTLVITDIASGWTECQALLHRSQQTVLQALERARQLLPFPLLGFDTDNGKEFINAELLLYCEQAKITFTRGRTANKNDQCYVEQKNGAIVRQIVGYDRFEGEQAYRQLTELYRAARLYGNLFQPSMKLVSKQRDRARVRRKYDQAQTPLQRLLASDVLTPERRAHLEAIFQSLDPVQLLRQLETLQEALWQHAVFRTPTQASPTPLAPAATVTFDAQQWGPNTNPTDGAVSRSGEGDAGAAVPAVAPGAEKRKYHRSKKAVPHTWRTRPDPFAEVWVRSVSG